jgi:hypothetical protein
VKPYRRLTAAAAAVTIALTAAPEPAAPATQLDSQYVLQRYSLAIEAVPVPKNVVFTYAVSQVGPSNIEQRHTIYRSGLDVRDETLSVDGNALARKVVRFSHRDDRYAVGRMAPRAAANQILFLRSIRDGGHLDYAYEVTPLLRQSSAFVDRVTIDGVRFLPRVVHFRTAATSGSGTGEVQYAPFGPYWLPVVATVDAIVNGKPARERITWGDYRFPEGLPPSTFQAPRPLPHATASG